MPADLSPVVILVNPQMGENIGAAMRAMMNFGIKDIRLVNPRDGWPNPSAVTMSSGAIDCMDNISTHETLSDAAKDCHKLYATTARPRDMVKPVLTASDAAQAINVERSIHKSALVFGAERTGLENEDISQCNAIVEIPVNPDFKSLNLGQAVLLTTYEVFLKSQDNAPPSKEGSEPLATHEDYTNFLQRLETTLDEGGFFKTPEMHAPMMRNIRNLFMRTNATEQELRTLHGVITTLVNQNG